MAKLKVDNLVVSFGGLRAVNGVSFESREGEILSVVGPNGAGKTTLFNAITRYVKPTSGSVTFDGKELTHMPIHGISKAGVIRTFQKRSFFPSLSVMENVLMGQHMTIRPSPLDFILLNRMNAKEQKGHERALELLDFVGLTNDQDSVAGLLPYVGSIDANKTANPEMAELFLNSWNEKGYEMMEIQEGARGFDAMYVMCEALKSISGDITSESINEALKNLECDTMSYGHVKFTDWGNFVNQNITPVAVIGIKDGKEVVQLDLTYPVYAED